MIWVMTYFGNIAYKCQYPQGFSGIDKFINKKISFKTLLEKSYFLIPIFIFCFFAAVRFQVGADCESYKKIFYEVNSFAGLESRDIESAFLFIANVTGFISDKHYLFMFVMAFLQISLLYYAQRKTTYSLKFFGLALILSSVYFSLMNGMRQNIAACAFVALVPLVLEKKNWVWYIGGVILAGQMHKSAFVLFLLGIMAYFLQYRILNRYIQLCIIAVCFVLMDSLDISSITNIFSTYGTSAGYDDRAIDMYSTVESMTKAFGFSSFLQLFSYIIVIWYSVKMQNMFNNKLFNIQYNLFFIGICIFLMFYNNFVINRLLYYLNIFIPYILASCMFYLWNSKKRLEKKVMFRLMIFILVVNFMYILYAASQKYPLEISLYKFDLI